MRFGIIVFPGSNCDHDCKYVVELLGHTAEYLWYADRRSLDEFDCIIVPGGFSYGDYLRAGALARFAPLMEDVQKFADKGGLVIGICNGFQILLEAGLLPGAMQKNRSLKFQCEYRHLKVENADTPFTNLLSKGQVILLPIAHGEGNYYLDPEGIARLEANGQILFRYSDAQGNVDDATNPNGSISNIAGVANERKNVFGLMPHPERAVDSRLGNGGIDGRIIFASMIAYCERVRYINAGCSDDGSSDTAKPAHNNCGVTAENNCASKQNQYASKQTQCATKPSQCASKSNQKEHCEEVAVTSEQISRTDACSEDKNCCTPKSTTTHREEARQ